MLISSGTVLTPNSVADAEEFFVDATVSPGRKCERCWHYRDDVGNDPSRPELCGRCTNDADLCGGNSRKVA